MTDDERWEAYDWSSWRDEPPKAVVVQPKPPMILFSHVQDPNVFPPPPIEAALWVSRKRLRGWRHSMVKQIPFLRQLRSLIRQPFFMLDSEWAVINQK